MAVQIIHMLVQRDYKPGDQAPEGYLAWHEWAEVQYKAGLRQKECGRCGLWKFPQELSAEVDRTEGTIFRRRRSTKVTIETPVCNECNNKSAPDVPEIGFGNMAGGS